MSDADESSTNSAPLPPWRVLSSRTLVEDRWLRVRADACVTADGVEISPFYVLDFPDWVLVVALDADDHILLVEQYRHGLAATSVELPCGGVDQEDVSPLATGMRELVEETGYGGGDWRSVARLSPNPATHSNFCHIVLAQGVTPQLAPVADPAEKLRLIRMPVQEAVALAIRGGIMQAMHVAAMALALGQIGKWRS